MIDSKNRKSKLIPISKSKRNTLLANGLASLFRYVFLISMCYVVLYPLLYMLSSSVKILSESLDPSIVWLPRTFTTEHYKNAIKALDLPNSLYSTLINQLVAGAIEIFTCAFVAYGMARFNFKLKKILTVFLILIVFIPPQMIIIPMVQNFGNLDFFGILGLLGKITGANLKPNTLDTVVPFWLPSIFAVGLRSGLMIFIYIQFFKGLPKELEEAAWIDGAGPLKTFFKIALPSSGVVILTVSVFSVIWHWNDYYLAVMYMSKDLPLAVKLTDINSVFDTLKITSPILRGSTSMAACAMYILPVLVMYMILQKKFIKSIDRVGITG